ncbi:MAG: YetF domain-containing protein [Verrucomicrobiota bacterium]
MWTLTLPWWEFVVRGAVVYIFVIVLLRLTGKRQTGQMEPFDLVLLLVLSNAVQNSMNGGDNSLSGGLILAATLVGLNWFTGWITFKSRKAEILIEGRPELLIHNGNLFPEALAKEKLTHAELMIALRREGCLSISEVRAAFMESNGTISVVPRRAD